RESCIVFIGVYVDTNDCPEHACARDSVWPDWVLIFIVVCALAIVLSMKIATMTATKTGRGIDSGSVVGAVLPLRRNPHPFRYRRMGNAVQSGKSVSFR
ncbi:MAG: hypothetical protein QF749_13330, partial [Verrucomicrobiota bacterium]|nr:hypothetical protein [Verrucomicrobiota bacterium]